MIRDGRSCCSSSRGEEVSVEAVEAVTVVAVTVVAVIPAIEMLKAILIIYTRRI